MLNNEEMAIEADVASVEGAERMAKETIAAFARIITYS
jgi:hypothetical protein